MSKSRTGSSVSVKVESGKYPEVCREEILHYCLLSISRSSSMVCHSAVVSMLLASHGSPVNADAGQLSICTYVPLR